MLRRPLGKELPDGCLASGEVDVTSKPLRESWSLPARPQSGDTTRYRAFYSRKGLSEGRLCARTPPPCPMIFNGLDARYVYKSWMRVSRHLHLVYGHGGYDCIYVYMSSMCLSVVDSRRYDLILVSSRLSRSRWSLAREGASRCIRHNLC
jgi:hypothetical protein